MNTDHIQQKIEATFDDAIVYVSGDDHSHCQIIVISDQFINQTKVAQQKRVYQAISADIERGDIHAVEIKTYSHDHWSNKNT